MRRRSAAKLGIAVAAAVSAAVAIVPALPSSADAGSVLYEPDPSTNADDKVSYEDAIRLQNSGSANGTVLATFERQLVDGSNPPKGWLIYRSTDGGQSFEQLSRVEPNLPGSTTALQPSLLELSRPVGDLPAGTLLLAGQTVAGDTMTQEVFRSTDHGQTWQHVSDIQTYTGGPNRPWEPELIQLDDGRIVAYYSEEVEPGPTYQQHILRRVSDDGGTTWGEEGGAWVSENPVDRPGMPTVARMGDGRWIMSVELCGGGAPGDYCRAHVKTSTDGLNWGSGPADMGIRPMTTTGHPLHGSPYVTWTPAGGPNGTVILSGRDLQQSLDLPDTRAGGHGQTLLVNHNYGEGEWYELTGPMKWSDGGGQGYQSGYRNAVLPSEDGKSLLYLAATHASDDRNKVVYGTANAGVLPYAAPFGEGTDTGWNTFGGDWSVDGGVYTNSSGGQGDKAIAGSTAWTDYTVTADVRLDGAAGNAGLLVRATDPNVGVDAHNGYYVALSSDEGGVLLGRQQYDWNLLSGVHPMQGGVSAGTWYEVNVTVSGCDFEVSAQPADGSAQPTTFQHTDEGCALTNGGIGVRTWNTTAAWRNLRVDPL